MGKNIKKILNFIANHIHLHIRGDENTVAGICCLGGAAAATAFAAQDEPNWKAAGCCMAFSLSSGAVYCGLEYRETKKEEAKRAHEVKMAEIRKKVVEPAQNNVHTASTKPLVKAETMQEVLNRAGDAEEEQLVGNFISEAGRIILFSRPGQGKSTLCTQIGIDIASGVASKIIPNSKPCKPKVVLLYNAELKDRDIQKRYKDYKLPNNLKHRHGTFDSETDLINHIKTRVDEMDTNCFVIIDNITKIIPTLSAESARKFWGDLELIQEDSEKRGVIITYLVICHAVKIQEWHPITDTSLQGSANLLNFSTAALALAPTNIGEDFKMLKVIKNRNYAIPDSVYILERVEEPYLHFEFVKEEQEINVLPKKPKANKEADGSAERKPVGRPAKAMSNDEIYLLFDSGESNELISQKTGLAIGTIANKRTDWKKYKHDGKN